jgi:hypothetical protein
MDKEVARQIIRISYRSGAELQSLIPVLKARCDADDYKYFVQQIAMAIDGIHVALVDAAVTRFPELEKEMEENLTRTGRVMP